MQGSSQPIPVTVLSGFLGAGKTTLLQRMLHNRAGQRFAVIVNDMASLNVDAELVRRSGAQLRQVEEELVSLENGCICCTLREDLLREVRRLADEQRFDAIVVESTGIAEPLNVAETFTFEPQDGSGRALQEWAALDTMVTVVDAAQFFSFCQSTLTLQDTGEAQGPDDWRTLSQLLVEQVEFADVVLINKCDVAGDELVAKVEHAVRSLNARAEIIRTTRCNVDLDRVLRTGKFNMQQAAEHPGWLTVMRGQQTPESETYGVSSFVWRSSRPFNPIRLHALTALDEPLPGVIRSKGFVWIASHPLTQGEWASAGRMYSVQPIGVFQEDEEPEQAIVIIGLKLNVAAITKLLDDCLATDEELESKPWEAEDVEDPYDDFEAVEVDEDDDEHEHEEEEGDDCKHEGGKGHSHHHHHHHHHDGAEPTAKKNKKTNNNNSNNSSDKKKKKQ